MPRGPQAILAGQAIAGLGVALASFATTWASPPAAGALTPQHVSRPAQVLKHVADEVMLPLGVTEIAFCMRVWTFLLLPMLGLLPLVQAYFLVSLLTMVAAAAAYCAMWTLPYARDRCKPDGGVICEQNPLLDCGFMEHC